MISLDSPVVWLFALGSGFFAIVLYWAHVAQKQGSLSSAFIDTRSSVPSFTIAVIIAAASFVPFYTIGFSQGIAQNGYAYAAICLGTIIIPMAGLLVFKRIWAISANFGTRTQASLFDEVLENTPMAVLSAGIALFFAIALCGRLMTGFALQYHMLTDGTFDAVYSLFLIAGVIAVLTVIGGMRGIAYAGTVQTALGLMVLVLLTVFTLYSVGGVDALLNRVIDLQTSEEDPSHLFKVSGVVQFTLGIGAEGTAGSSWTAAMIFSTSIAFLGLHAAPVFYLYAVSSEGNGAFGAGLTWLTAALFGGIIAVLMLILGSIGLTGGSLVSLTSVLQEISRTAPWFSAVMFFGLLSLVFAFVAACFLAAAQLLIVDIYKRYYHSGLSEELTTTSIRVLIVVLVLVSVLASITAPVLMAELTAICLPLSLQLLPGLVALTHRFGIAQRSVPVGAFLGVAVVMVTSTFGIRALEFIGLDLPWGPSPWTIHPAGWGLFANCAAVGVISVIMRYREPGMMWKKLARMRAVSFPQISESRRVISAAWSVALAWLFLAIGPGIVIGNSMFVRTVRRSEENILGMPSLLIWILLAWFCGVALLWFLAYRMQLASSSTTPVEQLNLQYKATSGSSMGSMRTDRMAVTIWISLGIASVVTILSWVFS